MDKSEYIVSSADVDIYIGFEGGVPIKLETGSSLNWRCSQSVNQIWAISYKDPIAVKSINASYSGSLEFQSGEWNALLNYYAATNTTPIPSLINSPKRLVISVTYNHKNPINPYAATTTFQQVVVSDENGTVNSNDPQSMVSIDFQGVGISRKTQVLPPTQVTP